MKTSHLRSKTAFTLSEIMMVLAIAATITGISFIYAGDYFDSKTIENERKSLKSIHDAIRQSFDDADPTRNIAALSGLPGLPAGTQTVFDDATSINAVIAANATVVANSWQAKVSRVMNYEQVAGSIIDSSRSDTVWFNARYWRRILLVGSTGEKSQRYLLLTLTMPVGQPLIFPSGTSVFDDIWNNNWNSSNATAPSAWTGQLTASQLAEWNSNQSYNRNNASRLIVERITQPKHPIFVANNSPTDYAWVDIGSHVGAITSSPESGVMSSNVIPQYANGVLAGTWIVVRRGTSPATAVETQRFQLSAPANITVQ